MISSPSPPRRVGEALSGLTIEDHRAMTPLGAPPADTHAARGLRAHDFVPTGERLLSEERLDLGAGGGARGVGTGPARAGASGERGVGGEGIPIVELNISKVSISCFLRY